VISSVTNFGLFIQLDDYFVEGLVHVTQLGNDYYVYDEARMTLTGRRSGRTYAMGQKVKIQLAAANIVKHQLDFHLLGSQAQGSGSTATKPSKPRQGHSPQGRRHPRRR
jgi:ribonuclease R